MRVLQKRYFVCIFKIVHSSMNQTSFIIILGTILFVDIVFVALAFGINKNKKPKRFKSQIWKKSNNKDEGGGEFRILHDGLVFEKVGVNFSEVYGKFNANFKNNILGAKKNPRFWASGISVVMHMKNPKIPAMHLNTRFISTQKNWFGGGIDITPCIKDLKETKWFHRELKITCDRHNKKYYTKYKNWCDKYFYLNHRKETRGVGGIFFDYKKYNWNKDFFFVKDVGNTFTYIFKKIIKKKCLIHGQKKKKKFNF